MDTNNVMIQVLYAVVHWLKAIAVAACAVLSPSAFASSVVA
jgi:hypothetical protein